MPIVFPTAPMPHEKVRRFVIYVSQKHTTIRRQWHIRSSYLH